MHFKNIENISLFGSFFEKYGTIINNFLNEPESSEIFILSFNHKFAACIIEPEGFFATNPNCKPKNIAYNQINCDAISLTIQERFAFIAHEIGHIFDTKRYNEAELLFKEINADNMACKIGLHEELICGMQKIIESGMHKKMYEQIQQRISYRLSSK